MKKQEKDLTNKIEEKTASGSSNMYGGYSYVLDYRGRDDENAAEEREGLYFVLLAMVAVFTAGVLCIAVVIIADIFKNAEKTPISDPTLSVQTEADRDTASELAMAVDVLVEKCSDFTVSICVNENGRNAYGTGTVITSDGYIITCSEVVGDQTEVSVVGKDGKSYGAKVIGIDTANEIAVIKAQGTRFTAAPFQTGECVTGSEVAAMVQSSENKHRAELGRINAPECVLTGFGSSENERSFNVISTNINTRKEMRGAPLVNRTGKVIGVMVCCADSETGYALSVDRVLPIIYRIVSTYTAEKYDNDREVLRGVLGIDVTEDASAKYNIPRGILITGVNAYSPAVCAGLNRGDIIVAFDRVSVMSIACLNAEIEDYSEGDRVTVKVYRKGRIVELSFEL